MSSRLLRIADWEKLALDAGYKPEVMAVVSDVKLRHLERFFKLTFGQNPRSWLRVLKCRRVVSLISSGYSTKAAAQEAGFASASHLCHEFKKVYGVSPQAFVLSFRVKNGQNVAPEQ